MMGLEDIALMEDIVLETLRRYLKQFPNDIEKAVEVSKSIRRRKYKNDKDLII